MDFNSYLIKRLSAMSIQKSAGNDQGYDAGAVNNISIFSGANTQDLQALDYAKLLSDASDKELNEGVTDQTQKSLNNILKSFISLDEIQEAADVDGDGEVTEAELKDYISSIAGADGDATTLSMSDIDKVIEDLGIDLESIAEKSMNDALSALEEENDAKAIDELEKQKETEKAQQTQQAQSAGGSNGSGSVGGAGRTSGSGSTSAANKSNEPKTIDNMSLEELESEKQTRQTEMQDAQDAVNAIHSGDNEQVKAAQDKADEAKEKYEKALKEDKNVPDELKNKQTQNTQSIEANQKKIDDKEIAINNKESDIANQENTVSSHESSLSSLESSLSSLPSPTGKEEDKEKDAQIAEKKSSIESQISAKKEELEEAKSKLQEEKNALNKLNEEKGKLEVEKGQLEKAKQEIQKEIESKCSTETKEAMTAYNEAKANVESVKKTELSTATAALDKARSSVSEIEAKITEVKNKKTEKENSVNKFDFDFGENLTDEQKAALEKFEANFENNKDRYEAVAEKTGVPAELIAAIHWRESSGNFDTYLHNGDPLGKPTTHVPAGLNYSNWEDAACDAMTRYIDQDKLDKDDLNTYYDVAERYNGLGYRNKGVQSPYVWAGTTNYSGGKYVADGVYDANYVDRQLGVAVMLKRLMS